MQSCSRAVGIGQTTTEQGGLRVSWMSASGMSRDSIFTVALAVGSGINVNTYKRAQKRRFFQENVTAIPETISTSGLSYRCQVPSPGEQLVLLRLKPAIQKAVDRGEIPLMSAYMLSRIMPSRQYRFVDLAKNQRSVPCTQTPY